MPFECMHMHICLPTINTTLKAVLFILTERHGGSISAEHGLGFDKRQHIYYCQSQKAVSLMSNIKKLFDPKVIYMFLNKIEWLFL